MKHVIDTSEVLGTLDLPEGKCELCALAETSFDETANRLSVTLQAFLRPTNLLVKERHFRTAWLPPNETITESAQREECHEMAREIFHHWIRKVRESAPTLHHS